MLELSATQDVFLNRLPTKFRAYVGGYGCVSPETKVWTEFGLVRISDITSPLRVLSWNHTSQKFQLSLSGGSFPKGRATLYRVTTKQGEFVATGHHLIFSSLNKYLPVSSLCAGYGLNSCGQALLKTIEESGLEWLPTGEGHLTQTALDLMGSYANEARLYGQQFLIGQDSDQVSFPLSSDVQELCRNFYQLNTLRVDGQPVPLQSHNHRGQCAYHTYRMDFERRSGHLAPALGHCAFSEHTEHTLQYLQPIQQFAESCECHRKNQEFSAREQNHTLLHPSQSPLAKIDIIAVSEVEQNAVFYDMQVLDTNNYVDEFGFIHHNSGKTYVGCLDNLVTAARHPKIVQGYFAPTYPQIRDIFYPTYDEAAHAMGFRTRIKTTDKEVDIYRGSAYYATTICRSMDNPDSIVGFKIARALTDEIDTLDKAKAKRNWDKIIARLRLMVPGLVNGVSVTTTPEGFRFVYDTFAKDPSPSYSMVQASTYENAKYLPPDYISSLKETYSAKLVEAYIMGQFVNLTSGSIYSNFDRAENHSDITEDGIEPLHIGMDFNVGKMSAIVHVIRDGQPIAVDEIMGLLDTPAMILAIKTRYGQPGRSISIYPDASGGSRKSMNAGATDISQLQDAGFNVYNDAANPAVRDRINAMQCAFLTGGGERLYKVNTDRCPAYTAALEQQAYNRFGEPDKAAGDDHPNDAAGYFICHRFPVIRPVTKFKVRF